jgi:gamma-tubulin complex component 3
LKGGALASTIQLYTYVGSTTIYKFLSRILQEVCAPLINMIKMWMIHGDAHDLSGDFFIGTDPTIADDQLWYDKYTMNVEQIPTFLTYDLAKKVYLTGKGVNFIRKCCAETEWAVEAAIQSPDTKNWADIMESPHILGGWITKVYEATNSRLINLLFSKYKLLDHCESIRLYLLLAQGDFHQYLMDLMFESLSKPAEQIYKYSLS